jgi:hypothetical protein
MIRTNVVEITTANIEETALLREILNDRHICYTATAKGATTYDCGMVFEIRDWVSPERMCGLYTAICQGMS